MKLHTILPFSMTRDLIKEERIHFLYQSTKIGSVFNMCLAILTILFLWDRVDNTRLIYWIIAICFISIIRIVETYRFLHKFESGMDNIALWLYKFLLFTTISGFTWGISIWLYSPFNDMVTPVIMVLILGGISAGAAAVLSPIMIVYLMYVIAVLLPAGLWFLSQPSDDYQYIALMIFTYMVMVIATGNVYRRVLLKSIFLSHELRKEKEISEEASMAKSEFLSLMSHELRTPLNAILGFAQLLDMDEKPKLTTSQKENVGMILDSGRHLSSLINDVLEVSNIEKRKTEISIGTVLLADVINSCIAKVQTKAEQFQVELIIDGSCDYEVQADVTKLEQAVFHLLSNAIKYNQPHGKVIISSAIDNNRFVILKVMDTGIGIASENYEKLFKPFERLGQRDSNTEGTGISLYVTKRLIEAMNGKLSFISEQNKGSTFMLHLPYLPS